MITPIRDSLSPRGWGLEPAGKGDSRILTEMGLGQKDLENRARRNTYDWLLHQFNGEKGAFNGFYAAPTRWFAEPQTVNLIAPFQLVAAYDRFGDAKLLDLARRSADWIEGNLVETHPMSLVIGGVLDNIKTSQLWTKYSADYLQLNLGVYSRTDNDVYLHRAIQAGKFLLQAQNHNFATKYDHWHERWIKQGWQSFGRITAAFIRLHEIVHDQYWMEWAQAWADHGLALQAENGCFYLINNNYYSSDLAADEMRALIRMYQETDKEKYLDAAVRFADWHLRNQRPNGAWPLSEDRWGITVTDHYGPGDMPNIATSLLLLHSLTDKPDYVMSAVKALRYSASQQQLPGRADQPYQEDPNTHWGFWSWDPPYDYTMSADQSTHHVRGYWFFLDYFLSLPRQKQKSLLEAVKREDHRVAEEKKDLDFRRA